MPLVRAVARVLLLGAAAAIGGATRVRADPPAAPVVPAPPPVAAEEPDVPPALDARSKVAVERGVAWLRTRADAHGSFGETFDGKTYDGKTTVYRNPYGPTALALYALLKCGVPAGDPIVRRSFAYLKKRDARGGSAYEVAMKLLAVTATADPFKRHRASVAAGAKVRLSDEMRAWGVDLVSSLVLLRAPDGWRYWGMADTNRGGKQDLSSTQMAALALFSAERCGLEVDPSVWAGVLRFVLAQQEPLGPAHPRAVFSRAHVARGGTAAALPDGLGGKVVDQARGFAYILDEAPLPEERVASGGMTACGVASLLMARHALVSRAPKVWASVDEGRVQQSIYDGLAWLDRHWSPTRNPIDGAARWHVYYAYCVERALDLVGSRMLGRRAWYVEMAEPLLATQKQGGSWDSASTKGENGELLDTCFALLFLDRATRGAIPVPSVTGGGGDTPQGAR